MGDTKKPLLQQHQQNYSTQDAATPLTLDAILGQYQEADPANGRQYPGWVWPSLMGRNAKEAAQEISKVYGSTINTLTVTVGSEGTLGAITLNSNEVVIFENRDGKIVEAPGIRRLDNVLGMKTKKTAYETGNAVKKHCVVM